MDLGIRDKIAVVVGGGKGLGRATAHTLAEEGARVVVAARTATDVATVVGEIRERGGAAAEAVGDMTTPAGMQVLIESSTAAFGQSPDIAISSLRPASSNVAPGEPGGDGRFLDVDLQSYRDSLEATVIAWALLARTVIPGMRERRWGRLVNIGAGSAKEPPKELSHVLGNTTRSGVVTLNKTLANEFGVDGITVNSIGTGLFNTGRKRHHLADGARQQGKDPADYEREWCAKIPVGRAGEPEEMAALCAFLCSTGAAYLTGLYIAADGGATRSAW